MWLDIKIGEWVAYIEFLHSFLKEAGTVYDVISQPINQSIDIKTTVS